MKKSVEFLISRIDFLNTPSNQTVESVRLLKKKCAISAYEVRCEAMLVL